MLTYFYSDLDDSVGGLVNLKLMKHVEIRTTEEKNEYSLWTTDDKSYYKVSPSLRTLEEAKDSIRNLYNISKGA